jgi:hypothetical protein
MFDIKQGTLDATAFNLLKAQEEYLFARGWKVFNRFFIPPEGIYDGLGWIYPTDVYYTHDSAMELQVARNDKDTYG